MISLNRAWDDSVAFIQRERALLVPLALATLLLGDVLAALAGGPSGQQSVTQVIAFFTAAILSVLGQLAILAMVLRPGRTVGDALRLAGARLGKVIAIGLLLGLVTMLVMTPLAVAAVASGVDPADPASFSRLPGWVAFALLVVLGVLLWLGMRLALLNALIVDRNPPIVAALRESFAMTRGVVSRLLLVFLVYLLVLATLQGAVRFVLGSLFALLGGALGSPFAGAVLTALAAGIVTAALSTLATVFVAMLYARTAGSETVSHAP